ncbi:mechanosensitive ion channel domain-containing protein, partial [Salmonella enterica]|uniref:mechanosensitive ion channel domain-containing protein n=1 Tax=Salmonella enterica TaxID=28901 RepID=UPI00398C7399
CFSSLSVLYAYVGRYGNRVALGSKSGTVSNIGSRAITSTDFERKKETIPTRAFVTERLLNWALCGTTTRLVIRVGVAYGCDQWKATRVLLQASIAPPTLTPDPDHASFVTTYFSRNTYPDLLRSVRAFLSPTQPDYVSNHTYRSWFTTAHIT